jgi:hypothetical protein
MRVAAIAFILIVCASQEANAARWAYIGQSANRLNFIASESIARGDNGVVNAWFLTTNNDSSAEEAAVIKSVKVLHVFDCKKRMYGVLHAIGYKGVFGLGNSARPPENAYEKAMIPVAPGTTGEEMMQFACLNPYQMEKFLADAYYYDDTAAPAEPKK